MAIRMVLVLCLVTMLTGAGISMSGQQDDSFDQQDRLPQPVQQDAESTARSDFMRTKLLYTQNIFHGLTTGDFEMIIEAVKEVQMITEGEAWVQVDSELYRKLTEEFKVATKRLLVAAESGNIDATALRYYALSTSCIDCHKHIRRANYTF